VEAVVSAERAAAELVEQILAEEVPSIDISDTITIDGPKGAEVGRRGAQPSLISSATARLAQLSGRSAALVRLQLQEMSSDTSGSVSDRRLVGGPRGAVDGKGGIRTVDWQSRLRIA
jgi:hypothetical protein